MIPKTSMTLSKEYYDLVEQYSEGWDSVVASIGTDGATLGMIVTHPLMCSCCFVPINPTNKLTLTKYIYMFDKHLKYDGVEDATSLIFTPQRKYMQMYEDFGLFKFGEWDGCHSGGVDLLCGFLYIKPCIYRKQENVNGLVEAVA